MRRRSASERAEPAGVVVEFGYSERFGRGLDVRELNLRGDPSAGRCPREVARVAVVPWLKGRLVRSVDHFYAESGQLEVVPERGGGVDALSWSS